MDYTAHYPPELRDGPATTGEWWRWGAHDVRLHRLPAPDAAAVVILLHGAGGHGAMLLPYGRLVDGRAEVIAPDLPGYGDTRVGGPVTWSDWIACVADLVRGQQRPVVLVGASLGGMLAYEVAASVGSAVRHVVATCLADPSDRRVRRAAARWPVLGEHGRTLLDAARIADPVRVPVRWLTRMTAMSADPELTALVCRDPRGGGGRVSLRFLRTWMTSRPTVAPEDFRVCPVTLAHPAADTWTPPELSIRFLRRIAAPTEVVMLDDAGHLPVEQPGLDQLGTTLRRLLEGLR
ncbi:alpha-beta hydrolase superfamily lysophospholipase [Actinomycetospora succinea]|uniref:Alpha-beta hydrolase superfamily lysophospholipase n=1 Tax=Actinomycetospora succinea TaxID=663603 RepID=A0A4R6VTJ6_9PSEU|nr:alpha/beta hydrolase [Actinomycetospora succinea]TDQ65967.1 alpha-beta hydrolase superfamily lysophospholipase [Actinomycetospora succinea]